MKGTEKREYRRPRLARLGNLKMITADWMCSADFEYDDDHHRGGHGGGHRGGHHGGGHH